MALRFIGKDPGSPKNNGSPTVWLDEADGSVVVQGWKIGHDATMAAVSNMHIARRSHHDGNPHRS